MESSDMDKDICNFFEINEPANPDELFLRFIENTSGLATPSKLINRYKKEYSDEFRLILLRYIHLTLSYPFDQTCAKPSVLLPYVCDVNRVHGDCMDELGNMKEMTAIFIELLYVIGYSVSEKLIIDDIFGYYDGLIFITSFGCVRTELEKPIYWGLIQDTKYKILKPPRSRLSRAWTLSYNKYLVEEMKKHGNEYEYFIEFVKRDLHFDPHYSYQSNAMFPCFLDGFFEPFFYNHRRIAPEELGKMNRIQIQQFDDVIKSSFRTVKNSLHTSILSLIRCNTSCRRNFLNYIRQVYVSNTEIKKMVFDKVKYISQGFAYNLCCVLDKFCDRIIIDNKYRSIDFFYINRIVKEREHVKEECKEFKEKSVGTQYRDEILIPGTHTFKKEYNEFMSTVFTYKILYMDLSYIVIFETMEYLIRILYRGNGRDRRDKDLLIFYQLLFSREFALDEMHFLNFIVENALRIETVESVKNEDNSIQSEQQELCKDIIENNTIAEEEDMVILLDNQYYLPITKIMAAFFERFDFEVPEKLYELIGIIMASTMNINDKQILIGILARQPFALKKGLFKSIFEIYIKIQKYEFFQRISYRIHLNPIIYDDLNKNMMYVKNEGKKFMLCVIKDLEKCLTDGLDSIYTIKKLTENIRTYEIEHPSENLNSNEDYKKMKDTLKEKTNLARNMFVTLEGIFKLILYVLDINIRLFQFEEIKYMLNNTLNYNLKLLVGPKCNSLSVTNMEKYSFNPKKILGLLCTIYSYFQSKNLITATVDSNDFNINIIKRAYTIIKEKNIMEFYILEKFSQFVANSEKAYDKMVLETDSLQYPDEFLDPLTFDVMKDPVRLTTSNVVVDRSTFNLILASDGIDPFNRKAMDATSIVEEKELKNSINEYKEKNKDIK